MKNYNPVWDKIFTQREPSSYPFDNVVSFVFRNFPKNKPRNKINILEVGCGGGNNMLFLAQEGFNAYGIDGSKNALDIAKKRFSLMGLDATFIHGDFTNLPFQEGFFDLVIDRGAICCVDKTAAIKAIEQIHNVLLKNGKFLFNPYGDQHTSCTTGIEGTNGITTGIKNGTLVNVGDISFYNKDELFKIFTPDKWLIKSMRMKHFSELSIEKELHEEYELNIQKIG